MSEAAMIGWDVGGAHLKAARVNQFGNIDAAIQLPCALWRGLTELHQALDIAMTQLGPSRSHSVTMTGEMVDLFPDRKTGVLEIARTMRQRYGDDVKFYCGQSSFVSFEHVAERAADIASANWRATAEIVAKHVAQAVFVDIGSTTTDIISIGNHKAKYRGHDDFSRLVVGELVYCGVVRTPLMALANRIDFRGVKVPVIAEHFATTADVYRVLRELPDGVDQHPAADGGEKTQIASARRLARMIGRDVESADSNDWRDLASAFRAAQIAKIREALDGLHAPRSTIIGAGIGDFLIREIAISLGWEYQSFAQLLNLSESVAHKSTYAAPAVAVALLAVA
jgi:(4-(4-[2-(gamma-L-glutamylamino)ethyl]phenoxymethyl)furan-2-yl)methanamine synthase